VLDNAWFHEHSERYSNQYRLVAPDKTACSKGHPFDPENEIRVKHHTPYGKYLARVCRTCAKEYKQARLRKLKTLKGPKQKPSAEELSVLIGAESWVKLGLRYGVSDSAVRKWAKQYGLL